MGPYHPRPLATTAVTTAQLATFTLDELRRLSVLTRRGERDLVGSVTVTVAYRVLPNDALVRANATGGAFTVTLPAASAVVGQRVTVKRLNAGANAVTVSAQGTDTIDGAASASLTAQYQAVTVVAWQSGTTYGWDIL